MDASLLHPFEIYPQDFFRRQTVEEIFGEAAPGYVEIDLGSGDGGFLLGLAEKYPDRKYLGVERLLGRVRKVCRKANRTGLTNVSLLRLETTYAVEWLLPRGCADRVHLLFPDPWPKKKHHRRRLMGQMEFLRSVRDLLKPRGEFLFKTDHEDYLETAKETLAKCDFFEVQPWEDGDFFYPETDFEALWKSEGRSIYRLRMVRD